MATAKEPPKKTKMTKGETTRLSILNESEIIFAELGYSGARLEDVALAVSVHRASLIYYYPNKQELFDAVDARIFQDLEEEIEPRLEGKTDSLSRLIAIFDGWLDFMSSRTTAARMILRSGADVTPRNSNHLEYSGPMLDRLDEIVREGIRKKEISSIEIADILNIVGGSIIFFACNSRNFGGSRAYNPSEPKNREKFRQSMHKTVHALLRIEG